MDTGQAILSLLVVLVVIMLVAIYIGLVGVTIEKARTLGRSTFFWGLWAIINTPIIVIVVLHCAGETRDHRLQRIEKEEYNRACARIKASAEDRKQQNHERYMPNK